MLKIENNRLHYGGISFNMPNGLYVDTDTAVVYENGFEFKPQDKSFRIFFTFIEYEETTEKYIKMQRQSRIEADSCIYGDNPPYVKPIKKIKLNELEGFVFLYKDNVEAYFDSGDKSNIHLSVYIETKCIDEVLSRQDVKEFFAGIKIEKTV